MFSPLRLFDVDSIFILKKQHFGGYLDIFEIKKISFIYFFLKS